MFSVRERDNWVAIDLKNGHFYLIENVEDLIPFCFVEKRGETFPVDVSPVIMKKYNFLTFGGQISVNLLPNHNKVFGIIDFTHKTQYGKDDKNKFRTLFRPLSFSGAPFIIKTKNRLAYNVYAIGEITDEKFNDYSVLKCLDIFGQVSTPDLDFMSPFHSFDCVPKKWRKPIVPNTTDYGGIIDLRDKRVFSIDGDSTVDVDDAIHYDFQNNLHVIGIHIADVANLFFSLGQDRYEFLQLIQKNCTSIYPEKIGKIDMISEEVGEKICSLIEGEERNVISLLLEFKQTKPFELHSAKIHLSKIINKHKLTYKYVDRLLNGKHSRSEISNDIFQIKTIIESQTIFSQINESSMEEQYPDEKISRTLVCKLMTIYNQVIAKRLYDNHPKSIMRVHYGKQSTTEVENDEVREIIQRMETFKGYYRVSGITPIDQLEHRGLGMTYYTHATSPIRRFVDFWNQICLYENLYKDSGLNATGMLNINERIGEINWKQYQVKKAYEQMALVNIYHSKINGDLDDRYEGFLIGIEEENLQIYIPKMNGKIFRFQIDMESLGNILEVESSDLEISWRRKDNKSKFTLSKYMKIVCRIVVRKNHYRWIQKIGIELMEPSFSNFLLM